MQSFSQSVATTGGALAGAIGGTAKTAVPGRAQAKADGTSVPAGTLQAVAVKGAVQTPGGLPGTPDSKAKIASFGELYSGTEKKPALPMPVIGTASADGDAEAEAPADEDAKAAAEPEQDDTAKQGGGVQGPVQGPDVATPKAIDANANGPESKQRESSKPVAADLSGTPLNEVARRGAFGMTAPSQSAPAIRNVEATAHSSPVVHAEKTGAADRPMGVTREAGQVIREPAAVELRPAAIIGKQGERPTAAGTAPVEPAVGNGAFRSIRSGPVRTGDHVAGGTTSTRVSAPDRPQVPNSDGAGRQVIAHMAQAVAGPSVSRPGATTGRGEASAPIGDRKPQVAAADPAFGPKTVPHTGPVAGAFPAQAQAAVFAAGGQVAADVRPTRGADRTEHVAERAGPGVFAPVRAGPPNGTEAASLAMAAPAKVPPAQPAVQAIDATADLPVDGEEVALGLSGHGGSTGAVADPHVMAQPHAANGSAVVRQIFPHAADLMNRPGERSIEIALEPAELGRVRMTVLMSDSAVTLQITAERPETLDLMRRHIEELSQELRRMGYSDVGLSFTAGDRPATDSRAEVDENRESASEAGAAIDTGAPEGPAPQALRGVSASGIDIRV